jgi:hypothetical protein
MKKKEIQDIIDKVYPLIAKDYKSDAKVEVYTDIMARLSELYDTELFPAEDFESFAEYVWDTNKIYIYTSMMESKEDVIRSLIHECVHSNQDYEVYELYYTKTGVDYDNHPHEIEAEYEEKNWIKYE